MFARGARDGQRLRQAQGRASLGHTSSRLGQVDLVDDHELRLGRQTLAIAGQLGVDGGIVGQRVEAGAVEQMYQQARAFDVPQELVAQAGAIGRPPISPGISAMTNS